VTNPNSVQREIEIQNFVKMHGIPVAHAAQLWDALYNLGGLDRDETKQLVEEPGRADTAGAVRRPFAARMEKLSILHIALSELDRSDYAPADLRRAAKSPQRVRPPSDVTPRHPQPVFVHRPTGLVIYDGPGGTVQIESSHSAHLVHIGPYWSRVQPGSSAEYLAIADISYAELRQEWERRGPTK
jgi:hypothetical protein